MTKVIAPIYLYKYKFVRTSRTYKTVFIVRQQALPDSSMIAAVFFYTTGLLKINGAKGMVGCGDANVCPGQIGFIDANISPVSNGTGRRDNNGRE